MEQWGTTGLWRLRGVVRLLQPAGLDGLRVGRSDLRAGGLQPRQYHIYHPNARSVRGILRTAMGGVTGPPARARGRFPSAHASVPRAARQPRPAGPVAAPRRPATAPSPSLAAWRDVGSCATGEVRAHLLHRGYPFRCGCCHRLQVLGRGQRTGAGLAAIQLLAEHVLLDEKASAKTSGKLWHQPVGW